MKLLLIAPTFYPVHGGAGLRFYRYLPYFHENNIETIVICGTPKAKKFTDDDRRADWLQFQDGSLIQKEDLENAKILKYKLPEKKAIKRIKILLDKAIQYCETTSSKPDVVHIIAPMPFGVISRLKKIKKIGIKLIYSHTIVQKISNSWFYSKLQHYKIHRVLEQFDLIIVPSQSLGKIIQVTNPSAEIRVIPNGVDTNKFYPLGNEQQKQALRNKLGLPLNAIILTLVGAIHPRKGTDILIDAWSQLTKDYPDLYLLLIGPRYDLIRKELVGFRDDIKAIIDKSSKPASINFLGQIKEVNEYLQVSDMFVFPSEREGMPNAVLEAMATGLPVVLTKFAGFSEEIGREGIEYFLTERSSREVARSIQLVLANRQMQIEFKKNAREWIETNMSIVSSVQSHANIYRSLIC